MAKKVVLAYSGGLDTSVILKWLQEEKGYEVITFSADLGQEEELRGLKDKAKKTGAKKVYIENLQKEFVQDYIFPALKANALYESKYLLATALGRPLIAKKMVDIAIKEKASVIAHGCTGKGNDQVRLEYGVFALAPHLEIVAPLREWDLVSREDEIEYAKKHNIPVTVTKKKPYSIDRNLWGISIECGVLEDPWVEPPKDIYQLTQNEDKWPDKAEYLEIDFERGIPKKINNKSYDGVKLIKELNRRAGRHGIGRADVVENRVVGLKSREIYEAPGGTILYLAHKELEALTLDKEVLRFKELVALQYARLIYEGKWFTPLKEALDGFVDKTQKTVTGTVRMKLYKGQAIVVGRKSKNSLYDEKLATYTEKDVFNHAQAEGFIQISGLPLKVQAKINKR